MVGYVQPIAQHVDYPERLILRGEDERLYLWLGEAAGQPPVAVEAGVVVWLLTQPQLRPLPEPRAWVHVDDLPFRPAVQPSR